VTIREAVLADIPHLVVMILHFIRSGEYGGHLDENPDVIFDTMLQLIESEDAILLVEDKGKPVGTLGGLLFRHPLSGQAFFSELFWWIEPGLRGNGRALPKQAEQWARERGATYSIMVSPEERVSRLYEKLGYTKLEEHYIKRLSE
jgi:GNAT superfamily N-acetyltransferase